MGGTGQTGVRFDVVSIFPQLFDVLQYGVVGRAISKGKIEVRVHDLRDYTDGRHRQVDDVPFGGGPGMILKPEPIFGAVERLRSENNGPVVLFEPWGSRFDQSLARELASEPSLVLVCGRYEGIDDRVREGLGAREISIGDFIVSGGEIPALVVIDAVARLLPGVVGDEESLSRDSFAGADPEVVGYPQYTRPAEFRGMKVPDVLLSGHHLQIESWRREQARRRTRERRRADASESTLS